MASSPLSLGAAMRQSGYFRRKENEAASKHFSDGAAGQLDFLKRALDYHIADFLKKRNHNRSFAFGLKMYSVVISAVIAVFLGVGSSSLLAKDSPWIAGISIIALFLSATVTVVSSWQAFSGYDCKWVRYTSTLTDLYELKDDFLMKTLAQPGPTEADITVSYDKLKQVLRDTNAEWTRRRSLAEKDAEKNPSKSAAIGASPAPHSSAPAAP